MSTSVGINGACGRMGLRLCAMAGETEGVELADAKEQPGHAMIGKHAGESTVTIGEQFAGNADAYIDFTVPVATRTFVPWCVEHGKAAVIGTTGLTDDDQRLIDDAGKTIPIIWASNYSLVVNVLMHLSRQAAAMLGNDYDIEVLEAHHRYKKDAPSGTALSIARGLCETTGRSFDDDVIFTRHGDEVTRQPNEITMQTLRIGDHPGEHTVYFAAPGERLEIKHVSTSRDSYVVGALQAAKWIAGKPAGRYQMADVLGIG